MQMHAIIPLTPMFPETKETLSGDDVDFIDSLRSVHSKSDVTRNRKPEPKRGQDEVPPPATQSGPADLPTQVQVVDAEPGGQDIAAVRSQFNSSPSLNGFITTCLENGTDQTAVTGADGLPELARATLQQITEKTKLKVQNEMPFASSQPLERTDCPTPLIADNHSGRTPKVPPAVFFFVGQMQKTAAGEPGQALTQANTVADLTCTCVAEILGHPMEMTAVTISALAPTDQQHTLTGRRFVTNAVTDHNAQNAGIDLTVQNISEQVLAESKQDSPGQNIMWGQLASIGPSAPHITGEENSTDLINAFIPTLNNLANHTNNIDDSTAKSNLGIAVPEHQLIDNVIQHVSLRIVRGQNSSISIRLRPEELGHLKMDLQENNKNIKAHIHVQNQVTQEILMKHLHRLREGLAQQGLVLDEIHVSVDSDTSNDPGLFNDQRTMHARPHHANSIRPREARETIMVETAAAPLVADGSINLRI